MVLTTLTNRYFIGYLAKDYEKNVNQILDYTKSALSEENISFKQMAIELGTHFRDPIIGIRLYSRTGEKLVDVNNANNIQNKNIVLFESASKVCVIPGIVTIFNKDEFFKLLNSTERKPLPCSINILSVWDNGVVAGV